VIKIVTSNKGGSVVANAVEFEQGGNVCQVTAKKEVVVSAGCVLYSDRVIYVDYENVVQELLNLLKS
jgi:hypothetical protein